MILTSHLKQLTEDLPEIVTKVLTLPQVGHRYRGVDMDLGFVNSINEFTLIQNQIEL